MAVTQQDEASRVTLEAWLATDIGVVRDHNEDSACMQPKFGFFIVADGMGGHAAGEVASAMAVETVQKTLEGAQPEIAAFKNAPTDAGRRGIVQLLQNAVLSAHQAVYQRGQNEADKAGMGTTLDVVLIAGPEAFVAHVGDSRTYLIREGRSSQITTDHTVAEVLVIEGKLTIEEAQVSPLRTILVNAIGVSADVGVEMAHVTLKRGDRLLLCSDGLHDYFPAEEEIATKLSEDAPGEALTEMVELAKTRGGHDNITGVVVNILDVIEAVPHHMEGESTQPVDLTSNNPFAADEPTETAFLAPPGVPSRSSTASSGRATQPLRTGADIGTADTIPPKKGAKKLTPMAGPAKKISSSASTDPMPIVKLDAETAAKLDGTPAPIATADTGPTRAAKEAAAAKASDASDADSDSDETHDEPAVDPPADKPDAK